MLDWAASLQVCDVACPLGGREAVEMLELGESALGEAAARFGAAPTGHRPARAAAGRGDAAVRGQPALRRLVFVGFQPLGVQARGTLLAQVCRRLFQRLTAGVPPRWQRRRRRQTRFAVSLLSQGPRNFEFFFLPRAHFLPRALCGGEGLHPAGRRSHKVHKCAASCTNMFVAHPTNRSKTLVSEPFTGMFSNKDDNIGFPAG